MEILYIIFVPNKGERLEWWLFLVSIFGVMAFQLRKRILVMAFEVLSNLMGLDFGIKNAVEKVIVCFEKLFFMGLKVHASLEIDLAATEQHEECLDKN